MHELRGGGGSSILWFEVHASKVFSEQRAWNVLGQWVGRVVAAQYFCQANFLASILTLNPEHADIEMANLPDAQPPAHAHGSCGIGEHLQAVADPKVGSHTAQANGMRTSFAESPKLCFPG